MAVRLSYRRTLVALVASVLLLIFYAEAILEIIGFKGLQVRTAAQLEQSGSHEHWINTEVKTEVESLIGISDSDPAIQDTELNVRLDRFPSQNLLSKGGEEVKVTFLLPDGAEVAEPAVKRAKKNTIDKFDTSLPRDHPCALFPLPEANRNRSRTKKGYRPCPVCYLPVGKAVALQPEDGESRIGPSPLRHLSYVNEQHPSEAGHAPKFGGHPTWEDRRDSFQIQGSMNVHCGFVWGASPGVNSGYDIEAPDREAMHACNGIVVASAIFAGGPQGRMTS